MGPRVQLISPIPPMATGPAEYLSTILLRISGLEVARRTLCVAIDSDLMGTEKKLPKYLHGIKVLDYRDLTREVPVGFTRIYFLANNKYHAYASAMLERQHSTALGRTIVVLHDPSSFMLHRYRTGELNNNLSTEALGDIVSGQYGVAGRRLLVDRLRGNMPDVFEFVTHAQAVALSKAHEIWVHSAFAFSKIFYETDMPSHHFPRIRLCAHPRPEVPFGAKAQGQKAASDSKKFRIGIFGWITTPKRVDSIIQGLSFALDRLGSEVKKNIEVVIVGNIPEDSDYDPSVKAQELAFDDIILSVKNADISEFVRLQQTCQLIFNLRYPSCGETSGVFASAETSSSDVVTTRYQAFNEVSVEGLSSSFLAPFEAWNIAAIICCAFDDYLNGKAPRERPLKLNDEVVPVEKLILNLILDLAPDAVQDGD